MPNFSSAISALILLIFTVVNPVFSQNIDSLLTIQRLADPQEKAYVQFDKNYYNPGETIWFKAYLFTGLDPSVASKNFYAELLDGDGNIIDKKTAPVVRSSAASNFDLSAKVNKSVLYCRAYTTGMLNGDTSFLFVKPIKILIPAVAASIKAKQVDGSAAATSRLIGVSPVSTIQFLPEGGDWVEGLRSIIAFKVIGPKGDPIGASGTIKDNTGAKILDFVTLHDGMGMFGMVPDNGKTYTATWKDANGKTYTTPLPQAKQQGIVLQVLDQGNVKKFIIQRTDGSTDDEKNLHIVAYMNQQLAYAANANLTEKKLVQGSLPTKEMPSGILQITVFDKNYKPLAERVCFVNNHDYEFDADAFLPQKNTGKRGQNTLEVLISDTMPANVSVAITDADLNQAEPLQDNLITHLLLTGDLKGKVANPYYYFFSTDDSASFHLDLVMLTHGWRRYNWPDVLAGKTIAPRFQESNYLSLNGQVAGTFAPGTMLNGIFKTADSTVPSSFISLPVSRNGKVSANGLVFFDYAKLYFQFSDKKTQFDKSMMTVNNGLRPSYKIAALDSNGKTNPEPVDSTIIANNMKVNAYGQKLALQRIAKDHELQNVTVVANKKTPKQLMEEKYVSGMFSGDAAASFDLTTDPFAVGSQSIFQYLQGKVAGLQINTTSTPPSLTWRGGSPALYLNEMQTDADQLNNTPVTDIAYIKVFRPGEAGVVANSSGGVIAVYTKKGGDRTPDPNAKGLDYVQLIGYSAIKQFYMPDYANPTGATDLDDVRPTIYWNPFIFLDKTKKRLRFKFPNTDIAHRFKLIMEGINDAGKLVHVEKTIE